MRLESNDTDTNCQQDSAKSPAQEWASPSQIARIFGFSLSWYRKSVRQRLIDAEVPTCQISDGKRGLRWHLPTITTLLTGGAA